MKEWRAVLQTEIGRKFGLAAVVVFAAVAMYLLNVLTPLFADDYAYSFSFADGSRMSSIWQIPASLLAHYTTVNGRMVTHALAQFFLILGDGAFNLVNTFAYLVLVCLIYYHAHGSFSQVSPTRFVLVFALIFVSCPAFGHSFLWITGASNYLYGTLIVLAFLVPYRKGLEAGDGRYGRLGSILACPLMLLFGCVAGWTTENLSVALIVMTGLFMVAYHQRGGGFRAWHVFGFTGVLTGCFFLLMAPGQHSRLAGAGGFGGPVAWAVRFLRISADMMCNFKYLVLLGVVIVALRAQELSPCARQRWNIRLIESHHVYSIGCLISTYSMVAAPGFADRVWSGPIALGIIVLLGYVHLVMTRDEMNLRIMRLTCAAMLVLTLSTYLNALIACRAQTLAFDRREQSIATQVAAGYTIVKIPTISGSYGYACYRGRGDLADDATKWPNVDIARYYGVDAVLRDGIDPEI